MSSDSRIAIVHDYSRLADSAPSKRGSGLLDPPFADASLGPTVHDPTLHANSALWRSVLEAEKCAVPDFPLPHLWDEVIRGRLVSWWESVGPDRVLLLAREATLGQGVGSKDASIVRRILCGDPQKVVASEFGIAPSTISCRYARALAKVDIPHRVVPLPLILAAQSASGLGPIPTARSCAFEYQQRRCLVVSVPRPATERLEPLTTAEQDVARCVIEGCSRFAIARHRLTSVYTVAHQFHSIFQKLNVGGRYSLIRRAVELLAFQLHIPDELDR